MKADSANSLEGIFLNECEAIVNGERNYWRGPAQPAYISLDLAYHILIKAISIKNSPSMDDNR